MMHSFFRLGRSSTGMFHSSCTSCRTMFSSLFKISRVPRIGRRKFHERMQKFNVVPLG
jgi:hypothetical protein